MWLLEALCIELWPLNTAGVTGHRSRFPGEHPKSSSPIMDSVIPHCCWIPWKEWQTFLMGMFFEGNKKGSANNKYTIKNAFSKAALGKDKQHSWRTCNYHVPCPTLAFSRENVCIYWFASGLCHMSHWKSATNKVPFTETSDAPSDSYWVHQGELGTGNKAICSLMFLKVMSLCLGAEAGNPQPVSVVPSEIPHPGSWLGREFRLG